MIHVACAADERYLPHCAAMVASLCAHHPDASVHFLHSPHLNNKGLVLLKEMTTELGGSFYSHEIADSWIEGLPRLKNIPPLMWYRAYLPELLPKLNRVLYLDADTLVMGDLTSLWQSTLENYYVAAVCNVLEPEARAWPSKLGISSDDGYFNSGVLLMNLDLMRRDSVTEQLIAFGRTTETRLAWPDQDALNKVLGGRRLRLHPRWNCQNSLFYYPWAKEFFSKKSVREAVRDPGILHFEGGHIVKPWHYLSKHAYRRHYLHFRGQTPWPRIEMEGKTGTNQLLRLLPTRWTIEILKAVHRLRVGLRVSCR